MFSSLKTIEDELLNRCRYIEDKINVNSRIRRVGQTDDEILQSKLLEFHQDSKAEEINQLKLKLKQLESLTLNQQVEMNALRQQQSQNFSYNPVQPLTSHPSPNLNYSTQMLTKPPTRNSNNATPLVQSQQSIHDNLPTSEYGQVIPSQTPTILGTYFYYNNRPYKDIEAIIKPVNKGGIKMKENEKLSQLKQQYQIPQDALLFFVFRTSNAVDVQISVVDPQTNQNVVVAGVLDSGAWTTAGSFELHANYCRAIKDVERNIFLVLPNKQVIQVRKAGIMNVTATNNQGVSCLFNDVLVFLVEDKSWTELLIGRPTLRQRGLLPSQNFDRANAKNNEESQIKFVKPTNGSTYLRQI